MVMLYVHVHMLARRSLLWLLLYHEDCRQGLRRHNCLLIRFPQMVMLYVHIHMLARRSLFWLLLYHEDCRQGLIRDNCLLIARVFFISVLLGALHKELSPRIVYQISSWKYQSTGPSDKINL